MVSSFANANTPLKKMLYAFVFCLLSRGEVQMSPLERGKVKVRMRSKAHRTRGVFVGAGV